MPSLCSQFDYYFKVHQLYKINQTLYITVFQLFTYLYVNISSKQFLFMETFCILYFLTNLSSNEEEI